MFELPSGSGGSRMEVQAAPHLCWAEFGAHPGGEEELLSRGLETCANSCVWKSPQSQKGTRYFSSNE